MKRALLILLAAAALPAAAATVTAYCPCAACCGRAHQPAANGRWPVAGVTIAGPRSLPFGTRVRIEGLGTYTITDRLARRLDDRFDIFTTSHRAAKRFGSRNLKVTIVK